MNFSPENHNLNKEQLYSITLKDNMNALVLAGAGSGKTKVLTHRIKYLITEKNCDIESILAVTFTNKAAAEMRQRLSQLLLMPVERIWVGTFHSIAHKILRAHPVEAGLAADFQIIDQQDQAAVIKRILKEKSVDESLFNFRKVQWFINKHKEEGIEPDDIEIGYDFFIKKSVEIFNIYNEYCQNNNLLDFAGILLKNYQLLKKHNFLLEYYRNKFSNILIDEFQDTNNIQYKWIKLLYHKNNVFFVGDEDQSIYSWRGARVENIQKASKDFQPIELVKLEQNYRSTGNILKAANAVIANNNNRIKKKLWTSSSDGSLINIYNATTEYDEAKYIANIIRDNAINNNQGLAQNAILYRSNAQSRVLEEVLIKEQLAYKIYGGVRFFERAEIKDAMSYVRLIENTNDNIAFERIINFPTRGIGIATIDKIKQYALVNNISFFTAAKKVIDNLPTRAANAVENFISMIESIIEDSKCLTLSEKISHTLHNSGIISHYENYKQDKAGSKKDNLEELISAAKQYKHDEDSNLNETSGFINMSTLEADDGENNKTTQCIQLMTIHAAKGLEFNNVFLTGLEENLFPSIQSKNEGSAMSEERRLFYVGVTRAMQNLYLSYADRRFIKGNSFYTMPSRFLMEIPEEFTNHRKSIAKQYNITNNYSENNDEAVSETTQNSNALKANKYKIGNTIRHAKFGVGTIINIEGSEENLRLQIQFEKVGSKWLIDAYANLELLH